MCDSESDAQHLVVCLLEAVLEGLNLSEIVEISQNRTLAGAECDVLLVYKPNRLPFVVIEVKKPGNSKEGQALIFEGRPIGQSKNGSKKVVLEGNHVAGEVFNEMKAIQLFGSSTVTGMISTGNQWQIVGLLDDYRNPKALDNFKKFLSEQKPEISPEEGCLQFLKVGIEKANAKILAGNIVPSHEGVTTKDMVNKVRESGVW